MEGKHTKNAFYLRKCEVLEKLVYLCKNDFNNLSEGTKLLDYNVHENKITRTAIEDLISHKYCDAIVVEYLYKMLVDPTFTHDKWNRTGFLTQ